jgi:hypothetical protein
VSPASKAGDEALSVREMLAQMRGRGMSIAEIGRVLQRSPAMVGKVLRGDTPGEAYRGAVTELYERGRVDAPPPRRRGKDGHVVAVRAAGGEVRTPEEAPRRTRGKFTESMTVLPGNARQYEITAPKTKGAKGRDQANDVIASRVRSAAKGQRWDTKRIGFRLQMSNGHSLPVGDKWGYKVSTVLKAAQSSEGGALEWLKTQAGHRYKDLAAAGVTVTGVQMTVYNHAEVHTYG